jgi:hypothetical protein
MKELIIAKMSGKQTELATKSGAQLIRRYQLISRGIISM